MRIPTFYGKLLHLQHVLTVNFSLSDIDECLNSTICGPYSVCTNQPGAFSCVCQMGFKPTHPDKEPRETNICVGNCIHFKSTLYIRQKCICNTGRSLWPQQNTHKLTNCCRYSWQVYCFDYVINVWKILMNVSVMIPSVVQMPTAQTRLDFTTAPASSVIGWTAQTW